jgi:hypothetical protein
MQFPVVTELQQAFIEYSIARAKFEILEDMSIGVQGTDVSSFDDLAEGVQDPDQYFCESGSEEADLNLFTASPGEKLSPDETPNARYEQARAMIRAAVDEWLRSRPAELAAKMPTRFAGGAPLE